MQPDSDTPSGHTITGYSPNSVLVNGIAHTGSLLLGYDGRLQAWQTHSPATGIGAQDLAALASTAASHYDLILLGTGQKQQFPTPQWLAPLIAQGIALEAMSTPAACRTYNMLAAAGRRVLAALWVEHMCRQRA